MAVKILSLGGTDWVNGDILTATDLIETIEKAGILVHQIYTGTGFNVSGSGDTDEHELNAITNTNANKFTYVKISLCYKANAGASAVNSSNMQLKIQSKETGGGYGDEFAFSVVAAGHPSTGGGGGDNNFATITWYHTLSAGEKTNGLQFKILTKENNATGIGGSITNLNTIVELI